MPRKALIQKRRGTAAAWTSADPTLAVGEEGFETDTRKSKVGDGSTAWSGLSYTVAGGAAPTGTAGGVLDGSYPNPGLAAGVAGAGLAETSDVLSVNVDGSTLEINSDTLRVKDAGVTAAKLASGAAASNLGSAGGDLTGTYPNPTLATAGGGAAGPTGSATVTPIVTVDAKGRVTALSSATTVPTNAAGGDLTGNYPNPTLAAAGPGATGPLGDATHVATVTIDAKGRVTALSSTAITYSVANLTRSPRSSNTILAAGDKGTVICATAAYTQTLTAAATLGAGWWVIVKNDTQSGTVVLTVTPNGSETIDGLTPITMYSGETRLIECDGSNFTSQLLEGGYLKCVPSGIGTFVVPAGLTALDVVCIGSGGQGGGGFSGASGSGGGGGGGGAVSRAVLRASDFTAGGSVTVTVAAGGSAAGSATNPGSNGSATSFGTALTAGGGGGGRAGASGISIQGGAGGSVVNTASGITAGTPASSTAISGQGSTPASAGQAGNQAEWGGASGAGQTTSTAAGKDGGSSIFGGPGGGSGGAGAQTGGVGGKNQAYASGGGPSGGSGGASPLPGGSGAATVPSPYCGQGGGGGGGTSTSSTTAGIGGAGGIGAGGGGGGSGTAATGVGGAGGNGGPGECQVRYW